MSSQVHPLKIPMPPMEDEGRIRTKAVRLAMPNGSRGAETPEIILWAGPGSLFISADLRGIEMEDLQIRTRGTRLIFHGTLRSKVPTEDRGDPHAKKLTATFSHALDLPYEIDVDKTEVQNENGLISIILGRKASGRQNARLAQSSFNQSMQSFFGESGGSSNALKDEITILETLERYLEYHFGKEFAR